LNFTSIGDFRLVYFIEGRPLFDNIIEKEIEKKWEEILNKKTDETPEEYNTRKGEILQSLRTSVERLSRPPKKQLRRIFSEYGWSITHSLSANRFMKAPIHSVIYHLQYIGCCIDLVVESRNALFHRHRFISDDDNPKYKDLDDTERKMKRDIEFITIELFIPLLFATILGYQGEYWDYLQDSGNHPILKRLSKMPR
jgi:hypothetical protein